MLLLLLSGIAPVWGAEAADAQITAAVADIEKYERQFGGQTAVNPATINRTLRLLGLTRERLDGSPNKSHASWIDADRRLRALVARLEALANPSGSGASTAAATAPTAGSNRDAAPAAAQMISQQRVRIQKLLRDIASATDTMDRNGVKPFQDADYVAMQVAMAARFKDALAAFADFASDADVIAATDAVTKFENMIVFGRNEAAKQSGSLGDVQARLRAIEQQRQRVPETPVSPYVGDAVSAWLVALARSRQEAAGHLQQLSLIREHAHLPDQPGTVGEGARYDMQDVNRLDVGFREHVRAIDDALAQFTANLDLQVEHLAHTLDYVNRLDPANEQDQLNALLGAGRAAEVRGRLAEATQLAGVAVNFDRQLGREQLAAHQSVQETVARAVAGFEAKLVRARELVRVPKAVSTDRALLAIARETLANPQYEVGAIRRLVINAEKVHREKRTSETEFDKIDVSLAGTVTLSGTQTTYTYAWDQFQVATIEPVDGTFYIFYNTLKHFTSGGPTTPLNRWILAERIQGNEIPEANIDRD